MIMAMEEASNVGFPKRKVKVKVFANFDQSSYYCHRLLGQSSFTLVQPSEIVREQHGNTIIMLLIRTF